MSHDIIRFNIYLYSLCDTNSHLFRFTPSTPYCIRMCLFSLIFDMSDPPPNKKAKRTHNPQRLLASYKEKWPCLRQSILGPGRIKENFAFCTICGIDIDISHQGAAVE